MKTIHGQRGQFGNWLDIVEMAGTPPLPRFPLKPISKGDIGEVIYSHYNT